MVQGDRLICVLSQYSQALTVRLAGLAASCCCGSGQRQPTKQLLEARKCGAVTIHFLHFSVQPVWSPLC